MSAIKLQRRWRAHRARREALRERWALTVVRRVVVHHVATKVRRRIRVRKAALVLQFIGDYRHDARSLKTAVKTFRHRIIRCQRARQQWRRVTKARMDLLVRKWAQLERRIALERQAQHARGARRNSLLLAFGDDDDDGGDDDDFGMEIGVVDSILEGWSKEKVPERVRNELLAGYLAKQRRRLRESLRPDRLIGMGFYHAQAYYFMPLVTDEKPIIDLINSGRELAKYLRVM